MKAPVKRQFAAFKSGLAWLLSNLHLLPATVVPVQETTTTAPADPADPSATTPTPFGAQITALQGVVDTLTAAAAAQDGQHREAIGDTAKAAALRSTLWDTHMKPIAQVARTVIPDSPSMAPALRLPAPRPDQQALITAATAMATQAGEYEQQLIAHGLPVDFIAQLQAATAAYNQALIDRRQAIAARKGATSDLDAQVALGSQSVTLIDTMLVRALGSDSATLHAWRSAKHVVAGASTSASAPASGGGSGTSTTTMGGVATAVAKEVGVA